MATVQILDTTETESAEFLPLGDEVVLVSNQSMGTWLVEAKAPDGNWVDIIDTAGSDRGATFGASASTLKISWPIGLIGRVRAHSAGAKIWAIGVHGP